ncbi:MAG: dipeptidase PepE [Nanoarchaeota archaeon]
MTRDLLLISSSKTHGTGYLDHCEGQIRDILSGRMNALFIPYARPGGINFEEYTNVARQRFHKMEFGLNGIHEFNSPRKAVENAEAIFVGGGNTFVLLKSIYEMGIMPSIRDKVKTGIPYIGTSAGSNVAGKTIMTTNDMPIASPSSFDALGLVPFVINPHYLDSDPNSTHMGETRETRIKEYHAFNDDKVVALREGAMLRVAGDKMIVVGNNGARVFIKGQDPKEYNTPESLDFLLRPN